MECMIKKPVDSDLATGITLVRDEKYTNEKSEHTVKNGKPPEPTRDPKSGVEVGGSGTPHIYWTVDWANNYKVSLQQDLLKALLEAVKTEITIISSAIADPLLISTDEILKAVATIKDLISDQVRIFNVDWKASFNILGGASKILVKHEVIPDILTKTEGKDDNNERMTWEVDFIINAFGEPICEVDGKGTKPGKYKTLPVNWYISETKQGIIELKVTGNISLTCIGWKKELNDLVNSIEKYVNDWLSGKKKDPNDKSVLERLADQIKSTILNIKNLTESLLTDWSGDIEIKTTNINFWALNDESAGRYDKEIKKCKEQEMKEMKDALKHIGAKLLENQENKTIPGKELIKDVHWNLMGLDKENYSFHVMKKGFNSNIEKLNPEGNNNSNLG